MPSWRDEYLSALHERDKKEKADQALYDQYTRLADRTARLQSGTAAAAIKEDPISSPKLKDHKASREAALPRSPTPDAMAKVRQDFSEAQRSRGLMETKLQSVTEELNKLKMRLSFDSKRIKELTKEKATLATGLRDRDEELRGKTKLLEEVHDETVSLTLQLNMSEEQSSKLKRENKELVDRWMARMGQEADAMNDKSKFS
ncbi:hypothetical protein N7G274_000009 [Stereocaulon virgatum]|uniref:Autophagy-related protein 16 domain-containing protein n=1 Tax=Stereocaulon virgatum TaxID=373712 RepID=A0ABR4AX90_9LECA